MSQTPENVVWDFSFAGQGEKPWEWDTIEEFLAAAHPFV